MLQNDPLPTLCPDRFKANFKAIVPLILEEWSDLSPDNLASTDGELERVVDCIATLTDRTRALIRRQLRELYQLALLESAPPKTTRLSERLTQLTNSKLTETELKQTIDLLEERTEELLAQFKKEVLPELNDKVRNNVGGSLLTALGIGFILGFLLGGIRGR